MIIEQKPESLPSSNSIMDVLQDNAWFDAVLEAEAQVETGVFANGFQKRGWMKTWPELPTSSQYAAPLSGVACV